MNSVCEAVSVRNVGMGITTREIRRHGLVESSRLEWDATDCFLWVSEDSNNSCSRLERGIAIEVRARNCASRESVRDPKCGVLAPGRDSPVVCFERVTSHSKFFPEPGRNDFALGEGLAVLQLECRLLVAAREIGGVGVLRGCERRGTGSLLRVCGLRVFESRHGRLDWGGIGHRRGEILLEVLQKLGRTPKFGAVMHMASSRGIDYSRGYSNTSVNINQGKFCVS